MRKFEFIESMDAEEEMLVAALDKGEYFKKIPILLL